VVEEIEEALYRALDENDVARVKTHEAVAYLVSRGVVDVGIGVRYIADKYSLARALIYRISSFYFNYLLIREKYISITFFT